MNTAGSPTLYMIPVPISSDALHTLPAYVIDIVRSLDFFVAERAKTARHFLKAVDMKRPLQTVEVIEMDEKNPTETETALQNALKAGKNAGILSEAGCPGVADPGARYAVLAHRMGARVAPLVGPSSLLLALMASGMNGQRFAFHGYLSPKRPELAKDLRRLEQNAERNDQTQLFIETPYRSQMVLEVALDALRPDTRFCFAQDITGLHEMIRSRTIAEWRKQRDVNMADKLPTVFLIACPNKS